MMSREIVVLLLTLVGWAVGEQLFYFHTYTGRAFIVRLDGSGETCGLPSYPDSIRNNAAVDYMPATGKIVACGGNNLADATACFAFNGSDWESLPDSGERHCWTSSYDLNVEGRGWWVFGGLQTGNGYECTDEWTSEIFTGEAWIPGPAHPRAGYSKDSCMVQLNATHSLFSGGGSMEAESWLYDWEQDTWTRTGDLNQGRYGHECAVLEGQGVLVAGGETTDDIHFTYTAELYDPITGLWTPQPDIPEDIVMPSYATMLPYQDTLVTLFWGHTQVFIRGGDGTWSPLPGVLLPEGFGGHFNTKAALVPDGFACT